MTNVDTLRLLAPVVIGYLLGSVPFGYLVVRGMRGIDIRDYGSHNIGATNVLRVVGWFPALLTLLGDIGKGAAPPVLATSPYFAPTGPNHWIVVLAAMAAIWGHAYSAYFLVTERRFAKGKAVATGMGAVLGFLAAGQVPWPVAPAVAAIWLGTVGLPRLVSRRWGWVSLASVLSAVALPVALAIVQARLPYLLFGVAAALFVVWKHKENIGRLLDGVEPRLGERVPLAGVDRDEIACAFMIHPMGPEDYWQTRRFSWGVGLYRAGFLPLGVLKRLMLRVRPMKLDTIHGIRTPDGRAVQVHLIGVPWLPDQIRDHSKLAVVRAIQAVHVARGLGARCLGLGAYWSVVGNKGAVVAEQAPVLPVTNGGAYTAGTVRQAVPLVFARLRGRGIEPDRAVAAVVGANGVVGFGICRQLLGRVARVIMIGTDAARLERTAALLRRRAERGPATDVVTSTDLAACRGAQVIFTATSAAEPPLAPEHVSPGTIVYDLGRPSDVQPAVLAIPGVTVIPGGVVRPPGDMRQRLDVHFGEGQVPACLAETILIGLEECYDRVSLGDSTHSENIDFFVAAAVRHGFRIVDEPVRAPAPSPAAVPARGAPVSRRLTRKSAVRN